MRERWGDRGRMLAMFPPVSPAREGHARFDSFSRADTRRTLTASLPT
jgi:hypothetical protein